MVYLFTPFLAWLAAGSLKFFINSIKAGRPAYGLIGYGGMPSTHSAIVSSMCALIAVREGMDTPAFGVAVTLAFIVMIDAGGLRRAIGRQAAAINQIREADADSKPLRERMGHSRMEISGGVAVGVGVGWLLGAVI